jgi:hypothetical protein
MDANDLNIYVNCPNLFKETRRGEGEASFESIHVTENVNDSSQMLQSYRWYLGRFLVSMIQEERLLKKTHR